MKLPQNTIKIGYQTYKIEVWSSTQASSNEAYGEFFQKDKAIGIDGREEGASAANTILHEILHGVVYQWGLTEEFSDEKEERIVNSIVNGFTQVLVDNTWLMPWLEEQIKNDPHVAPKPIPHPKKKRPRPRSGK
jgi:hypothetical protein